MTDKQEAFIEKALQFARKKHAGQKYGNEPFIFHPLQVSELARIIYPEDEEFIAAALLHDVLEDTDTSYEELEKEFGEDVANLVDEVTKSSYNTFPHLKSQTGVLLKFLDRSANLGNMSVWDESRQKKYIEKSKFWKE